MRLILPVAIYLLLFSSCAKENVGGFDRTIQYAQDILVDPVSGDTVYAIYMPDAFTPNGDGINDLYFVRGTGFDNSNFVMQIFNREGNLIWYEDDFELAWDGRIQRQSLYEPSGNYLVKIDVSDTLGNAHHYDYNIIMVR